MATVALFRVPPDQAVGALRQKDAETPMANESKTSTLSRLLEKHEKEVLASWVSHVKTAGGGRSGRIKEGEVLTQCRDVLAALREALASGDAADIQGSSFARLRDLLGEVSHSRAVQGFSPGETATFVLSLKQPLFERLRSEHENDSNALADNSWRVTRLLDQLGLYTMEVYQKTREDVVARQQDEIAELSTAGLLPHAGGDGESVALNRRSER